MKNLAVRLIAALVTFTVGLAAVVLWLNVASAPFDRAPEGARRARRDASREAAPCAGPDVDRPAEEGLPVLSYCELVGDPGRYDGKVVRVRATARLSTHGLFLSDATCDRYENMAALDFHAPKRESLAREFFDASSWGYVGVPPVELIAVGRFERVVPSGESDSLLDTLPLRFEIMLVEKAAQRRRGAPAGRRDAR